MSEPATTKTEETTATTREVMGHQVFDRAGRMWCGYRCGTGPEERETPEAQEARLLAQATAWAAEFPEDAPFTVRRTRQVITTVTVTTREDVAKYPIPEDA